jgi:hypothetical protein
MEPIFKYVITGILRNGKRFKPIYTNHPENYNIWQGTLWRILPNGRRKKIRDYIN